MTRSYRKTANWRPGARTHGQSKTATHATWKGMVQRCVDPASISFKYYGGRGITVCPRWRDSYLAFLEDMGPRPTPTSSIDRVDPNLGYEPGNCRWIDRNEQQATRRVVARITIENVTHTLKEWSEASGATTKLIWDRLQRGWKPYDAVFLPPDKGKRRAPK